MKQPIPFGNYYLMDLIAKGGMAEVFKAKYLGPEGFSKVVAVKRILPELAEEQDFIRMFIDEAKIASQLNHANVATILQLGEAQGTYFIAMEYVQGKDVRTIYERSRRDTGIPPDPTMAAFVLSQVCEGLDYAHRRRGDTGKHLGIIHRDISPQNVIVSYDGNVKLIDFGIAKAQDKLVKTEAGILKGKYCYMSPEQVRGLSIDHRSDIFGLGVVLHEVLTRQRLFLGSNDLKTLENVLQQPIDPPSATNPAVPPELDAICMRALERDVNNRYQFASDMHEELQRFLYTQPSVFTRRDLANYMHQVFGEDLDKELRRQASYEPFFEALPNTPLPSAMISTSSTALAAVPPMVQLQGQTNDPYQRPSEHVNSGSYNSSISQPDHPAAQNNAMTSSSGPHPHPSVGNQYSPAMAAPTQPPPAFPMSNPTSSMTPPPVARSQAPAQEQGGVQFFPGGVYGNQNTAAAPPAVPPMVPPAAPPVAPHTAPPAAPPPSFMFHDDGYEEEEEDDPTVFEKFNNLSKSPPKPSGDLTLNQDEVPTRQLSYEDGLAALNRQVPQAPPMVPTPPTQAIQQPYIPNEEVLQPPAPEVSSAPSYTPPEPSHPQPAQPPTHSAPTMDVASFEALEDEGADTMMQASMQAKKKGKGKQGKKSKSLFLVFVMMALLLSGGMAGLYHYRCQLFQLASCVPPEQTTYTLVLPSSANGVDVFLNNEQVPPHKLKLIGSNKIRLSFEKGGTYVIEIRKPGCQPLKRKVRIMQDMEMETPQLPLKCQ